MNFRAKVIILLSIFALCIVMVFFLLLPQIKQINTIKAFLDIYYNTKSSDTYLQLSEGNFEVLDMLYAQKYNKLISKKTYDQLVASRIILELEKAVQQYRCEISLQRSKVNRLNNTQDNNPVYHYTAEVRVDLQNNRSMNVTLTGTMILTNYSGKWMIDRFSPAESIITALKDIQE